MHTYRTLVATVVVALSSYAQVPTARTAAFNLNQGRICFDEARGRLVFVNEIGTLMEWNGAAWALSTTQVPGNVRPVYDEVRQRVYFVGGGVWEYDGHGLRSLAASPTFTRLTVDSARGRLVGARIVNPGGGLILSVEEFDGQQWTQIAAIGGVQSIGGLCFDRQRQRIVFNTSPVLGGSYRTWELDGANLLGPFTDGIQRGWCEFDATRGQVVSFGGSRMFAWDGSAWTQLPGSFPNLLPHSLAADPTRGWIHAMMSQPGGAYEHWRWNGVDWAPLGTDPQPLGVALLSYDSVRGKAVALAHNSNGFERRVHSEWDGVAWHNVALGGGAPPTFEGHASTFDAARGEIVVFGGLDANGQAVGTTHVYDGQAWRQAASGGPSPRHGAAMAYDPSRSVVVLVGGATTPGSVPAVLRDHWEWDGTAWTLVSASPPIESALMVMGYDPLRSQLVLLSANGRTYVSSGGTWVLAQSYGLSFTPLTRRLTWNPHAGALQCVALHVMFTTELMRWNGATWATSNDPLGEYVFDTQRGTTYIMRNGDTLVYSSSHAATASFGNACGGTATTTSLSAFGRPRFGNANLQLDLRADARLRPALLGFGLAAGAVPIGNGCEFLLQNPIATRVWFTDAFGFWHQNLPLPNAPALRGLDLFVQGAVLDPASAGGLAMTQGLRLTVGD